MWERLRPMLQGHISSPGVGDFKKGGRGGREVEMVMMRLMMTMMMDDTQTLRSFFLLYAAIPKCNRREAGPHWVQRPVTEWKSSVHCDWAFVQEDVSYLITRTYDCLTKHPGVTLNPIVFVSYIICNCVTAGKGSRNKCMSLWTTLSPTYYSMDTNFLFLTGKTET